MTETNCTREECYYSVKYLSIIIGIVFTILCIVYNSLAFTYKPYNDEDYIEKINSWKLTPIASVSINTDLLNDILNNKIDFSSSEAKEILILNRLKSKYDFEYLFLNNDTKHHPCGTDTMNNYLFLPSDMECPINYIGLSHNEFPKDNIHNYTIIPINNNLFLHYSNNFIDNPLINDVSLKITDYNKISDELDTSFTQGQYYRLYRDLGEKYYYIVKFHSKEIRIAINIITLIFLIIFIINFIITLKNEDLHCLHLLNILILVTEVILEVIVRIYLDENEFFNNDTKKIEKKAKYNNYLFKFFCVLSADYLVIVSFLHTEANFYYYLIYPFRYGYDWMNLKDYETEEKVLDEEIDKLNKKIEKYNNEINVLERKRANIIEQINEKNKELIQEINKKDNLKKITDKIKMERQFLNNNKNDDYTEYKNILEEIKKIEKEINYYKMISFQEKIYNNEGL